METTEELLLGDVFLLCFIVIFACFIGFILNIRTLIKQNEVPYIDNNHIKMLKTHYVVCFAHRQSKTHGLVFKIIKKLIKKTYSVTAENLTTKKTVDRKNLSTVSFCVDNLSITFNTKYIFVINFGLFYIAVFKYISKTKYYLFVLIDPIIISIIFIIF